MKLFLATLFIFAGSIATAAEKNVNDRKPSSKPGDFWCTDAKPIFVIADDLNRFCDKSKGVSLAPQVGHGGENWYVACCIARAE